MDTAAIIVTTRELATYFDIKKGTIYSKVGSKQLFHFRIGTPIQFKKENIDEWLLAQWIGVSGDWSKSRSRSRTRKPRNTSGERVKRKVIDYERAHILYLLNSDPLLYRRATP